MSSRTISGGDHRVGQHRHRLDDQDQAQRRAVAAGGDDRHRPASDGLARARRLGIATSSDGIDGLLAMPGLRRHPPGLRRHLRGRAPQALGKLARHRRTHARPHPGGRRAVLRPGGQPRGPHRRAEPQHGHLRRPGHRADRRRGQPVGAGVLRRDRVVDLIQVRRPGHPGQHRRVHRDDRHRAESRRRSATQQGGDHPQPGRSAHSHAQHRVLPRRGRLRPRRHRGIHRRDGRAGAALRAGLPAQAARAVRDVRRRQPAAHTRDRKVHRHQGHRDAAGDRRRALPAGIRRKPRHHDLGRAGHRRTHCRPFDENCWSTE